MREMLPHCSDDHLLELLAEEELKGARQGENTITLSHLEQCARCQSRIEQLASDTSYWQLAKDSLSSDEDDLEYDSVARPWATGRQQQSASQWTDSYAKQILSPPSHPEMLGRLGRYEVERIIGTGGMGVVFKAFDTELNRPVAIKLLAPFLAGSGAARKRFSREARAAAAIVHEHVVPIHNVETEGESPFLVMHYVAGESLQQRLDREGPLELCELLRIGMQVASGLAAAHAQGLVHRDIKPSNILLEFGVERSLLTDFGLALATDDASLTHTGYHPGTPQYMSPEQARGETVDARSDLFSLGSVLYTMCTGRPPFRAESSYGILRKITDTEARSIREVNPSIPSWLERLVKRLHAKSPENRFGSAIEVRDALEQCLAHVQQPANSRLPASISETWLEASQRLIKRAQGIPPTTMFRMALIASLLLGCFFAALQWYRPDTVQRQSDYQQPSGNTSTWDDQETVLDLENLANEVKQLEASSHSDWDYQPTQ